jgi:hypothetical protein
VRIKNLKIEIIFGSLGTGGLRMEKYVFVLPDSLTRRWILESPEPDRIEFHVYGLDESDSVQDTIQDLLEMNQNRGERYFDPPFSLRIETCHGQKFWAKDKNARRGRAG